MLPLQDLHGFGRELSRRSFPGKPFDQESSLCESWLFLGCLGGCFLKAPWGCLPTWRAEVGIIQTMIFHSRFVLLLRNHRIDDPGKFD